MKSNARSVALSIETRLIAILALILIFVSVIFISSSQYIANEIEQNTAQIRAERNVNLLLNIFQLKYIGAQAVAEDYTYWTELYQLVVDSSRNTADYDRMLGHLVDQDFVYVAIHDSTFDTLFEQRAIDTQEQFVRKEHDFKNLLAFGDVNHIVEKRGNTLFITSIRPLFDDEIELSPAGYLTFVVAIGVDFFKQLESMVDTQFRFNYDMTYKNAPPLLRGLWSLTGEIQSITPVSTGIEFKYTVLNHQSPTNVELVVIHEHSREQEFDYTTLLVLQVFALSMVVVWVYVLIRNYVTTPITKMSRWLRSFDNDNPVEFSYHFDDEIGSLAEDMWASQSKLREALRVQGSLLNAISDIIITTDEKMNVSYCNPKAIEWLGVDEQEVLGQAVDFMVQIKNNSLIKYIKMALKDSEHTSYQLYLAPFNQSDYFLSEVTFTQIDESRSVMLVIRLDQ